MSSKHERFTTSVNDSTGDLIKTKASGQDKYAQGWEAIFGKKEDMLKQLVEKGKLNPNVQRRHEEQNIGKGFTFPEQAAYPLGVAVFEEEEPTVLAFTEELLPSGIIGDEE